MSENQLRGCGEGCISEELLVDRLEDKDLIINGISDAIMLLDPACYRILDVNQAFLNLYRFGYDDVIGRRCYEITHHLDGPCSKTFSHEVCPLEDSVKKGGLSHAEHLHKDRDGRDLFFEITAYPVLDTHGQVKRIIHLSRDITDRKRAEEALREMSEKIKFFAYSVAHDLKSPAIAIHGLTQLLEKNYRDVLQDKGRDYCQNIVKASDEIAGLVDRINVFITTKENPLTVERINLKEILRSLKEEFSARLQAQGVHWAEPNLIPLINADKLSIIRMLRNLVDNVLRYGGGQLSHLTFGYEESHGFHIISVEDDGVGISAEESGRIFKPFERSVISRGIEGSGLGLAIVKEIAEQHNGRVWAEQDRKKGCKFSIAISKDLTLTDAN